MINHIQHHLTGQAGMVFVKLKGKRKGEESTKETKARAKL